MSLTELHLNPLWVNVMIFLTGAILIGYSGVKLEARAHAIAESFGKADVFIGMAVLAVATSLPEIVVLVSALALNNLDLAVHDFLGAIMVQLAVLGIADSLQRKPVTSFSPQFALLIQGVGLVMMLSLVIIGFMIGGVPVGWGQDGPRISLWGILIIGMYMILIVLIRKSENDPRWRPVDYSEGDVGRKNESKASFSGVDLWRGFSLFAAVIFVGGWLTTASADAMAKQTGLGSSFMGVTFLAVATSLPEISTTFAAVRRQHFVMAISDILGTNLFVIALLGMLGFLAPSIFSPERRSAILAAAMGILIACIYLWGLLERRDRTFMRMGWDSLIAIVLMMIGMYLVWLVDHQEGGVYVG